jgi:hypothetical protein
MEVIMKNYLSIIATIIIGINILLIGCKGKNQDEQDIRDILENSVYTDKEQSLAFEDNDTNPSTAPAMLSMPDTMMMPWVKFARKVTDFRRHVTVEIKDTVATATIGIGVEGYFIVVNDPINLIRYRRILADTGIRTVYLTKHDRRWRIRKVSPKNIWTKDAPTQITITNLKAEARPSGVIFEINNPDTLLTKDQLPTFHPDDTVKVTVTLQMPDDSSWVFLHRGPRKPHPRRREPFLRTSTHIFEREWIIRTDTESAHTVPEVRPSAVDAIQWQTLWGDSLASYNSRAWCLPYIVKLPEENYPDSE